MSPNACVGYANGCVAGVSVRHFESWLASLYAKDAKAPGGPLQASF